MLIRDIDKRLDMRIVLGLRQNNELFTELADLKMKFPAFIYNKDDQTWMAAYLPKSLNGQKFDILVKRHNAVEHEDSYVFDTRINNVKSLAIINKIIALPSCIINRSDISGGFVNIYVRFHNSQIDAVSTLLSEYASDVKNSRVYWLGPSPGIMSILELINSEYPVSLITFQIPASNEEKDLIRQFSGDVIAEATTSSRKDKGFSVLFYASSDMNKVINGSLPLSKDSGIYSFDMGNPFLISIREAANERHIARFRFFVKPVRERLEVSVFLPRSSVYDYYSMLFAIAREQNNKVTVKHILPFTQDVWNYV